MSGGAAAAALCMLGLCAGCGRGPGPAAPAAAQAARLRTAVVEERDFAVDEVVAPGRVEMNPNRVSKVLLPTPGRVRKVLVRLGDSVGEGQVLAVVESSEAGLALAAHVQAQSQAHQTATTLARAEKDLARARELNANKAAPLKEVINAEAEVELAKSALTQAQAGARETLYRLNMLGLDPAHPTHELQVTAPIPGKVIEVSVAPGELRNDTNQPLLTIADLSTVWVTSLVPESAIRLVDRGETLQIEVLAYPGEVFRGRVTRIGDTVEPETRTVKVQAELDNRDGRLRPEMFCKIRHTHGVRRMVEVPASAILHSHGSSWVMVEQGPGRYVKRQIVTGPAVDGEAPIERGLAKGERVVVDGAALLRER